MMKQLRDSFRLLKYSFSFKINVVCASVFLVLGLVYLTSAVAVLFRDLVQLINILLLFPLRKDM